METNASPEEDEPCPHGTYGRCLACEEEEAKERIEMESDYRDMTT